MEQNIIDPLDNQVKQQANIVQNLITPTILSSDRSQKISEMKSLIGRRMADRPFIGADGFPRLADGSINPNIKPLIQQ